MDKVQKESIITLREFVENEREYFIELSKEDNDYPLGWMKEQFGESLTEKEGLCHPNGNRVEDCDCNVCRKKVSPDEKIVKLEFSFCAEYSCGMNICHDCICRWNEKLK